MMSVWTAAFQFFHHETDCSTERHLKRVVSVWAGEGLRVEIVYRNQETPKI